MDHSREIFRKFKSRGLVIKTDASKELQRLLHEETETSQSFDHSLSAIIEEIQSRIEKRLISSTVIDLNIIVPIFKEVVKHSTKNYDSDIPMGEVIQIVSAYKTPKLVYDDRSRVYSVTPRGPYQLHGSVESRSQMYKQRYLFMQQRLLRSGRFSLRGMSNSHVPKNSHASYAPVHEISSIESLLGSSNAIPRILLGYITQPEEEGVWYLEDLTSILRLDFSAVDNKSDSLRKQIPTNQNLAFESGYHKNNQLYMEGILVLVQGFIAPSKTQFHVVNIISPPNESREVSKNSIGKNVFNELWVRGNTTSVHVDPHVPSSSRTPPGSPGKSSSPMAKQKQMDDMLLSSMVRPQYWDKLYSMEQSLESQSVVFLSDIQIDRPHVLEKLQLLFHTYEGMYISQIENYINETVTEGDTEEGEKPLAPMFILIGPFVSQPDLLSQSGREVTTASFDAFATLLCEQCPILLCNSQFVFVPSPQDVGTGNSLPNFPLSRILLENFSKTLSSFILENSSHLTHDNANKIGYGYGTRISNALNKHINTVTNTPNNIIFTTNPSRLHYYTQEIVIFRDDLMKKMQKHAIFREESELELSKRQQMGDEHSVMSKEQLIVETILDQGHLCPLMTSSAGAGAGAGSIPIYWDMDDSMRLFPLPTLLVLADNCEHYEFDYKGCKAINPGSFSCDFSFLVYLPATRQAQFSKVF